MLETVVILLILCVIFIIHYKSSGRKLSGGGFVLLLYIFSLLSSFFLSFKGIKFSFEASFYFLIILYLFIQPILKFNTTNIQKVKKVNLVIFNRFCYLFIILGFCSYGYFLPVVIRLFTSGKSILFLRTNLVGGEVYFDVNIFYYICTFFCQFYPIVLAFYFYSITFTDNSKRFNKILLFSSTAYIVNVLAGVGRDGFVLWTMSYFFGYLIFKRFMLADQRKKIRKLLGILSIVFASIFIPITIARFLKDGDPYTAIESVVSYMGQQFGNFNNFYNTITHSMDDGVTKLFPILDFASGNSNEHVLSILDRRSLYIKYFDVDVNVFATFIGSFYLGFSKFPLLIFALIYNRLAALSFYKFKSVSFGKILLFILVAQIPLHGVFYYKLAYFVSNIYMIFVLILVFIFSIRTKSNSGEIYSNNT